MNNTGILRGLDQCPWELGKADEAGPLREVETNVLNRSP